jgi:hypothetical protein
MILSLMRVNELLEYQVVEMKFKKNKKKKKKEKLMNLHTELIIIKLLI